MRKDLYIFEGDETMKIAILAAGSSKYFPLFIDKPKCLYHLDGEVQLERVINVALQFVDEKDIIIVGGYKSDYIKKYLKNNHQCIDFRVNEKYNGPSIYSFRKAIENVNDDMVFMFGDENISEQNVRRIAESKRKMALLCHDTYYYYSLGIMKLDKTSTSILNDDCYLSMDYMKNVYCFANNKDKYDGNFNINSGICIGYTMIDIVRRIGGIDKIENPVDSYMGEDIDFFHYDPSKEYTPDVDHFYDTDEYKDNIVLRLYSDYISDTIKLFVRGVKKAYRILLRK